MKPKQLSVIILAAGKGTRMKSTKAKVLHPVFEQPMAVHVIDSANSLRPLQTIVVIGHQKEAVEQTLSSFGCDFAVQHQQNGTAHAVLAAESSITQKVEAVLILCGDTPLISSKTLEEFYQSHIHNNNDLTLLTTTLSNPFGYGRILCTTNGDLQAIVEEKDATVAQKQITEVNAGIYCVQKDFLFTALKKVGTSNKQKEMYLTDIIAIGVQEGKKVQRFNVTDSIEVLGVNSRQELAEADSELQMRHNRNLMASGVSMISPETIRITPDTTISSDVTIGPCVHISNSTIAADCHIEQGTILKNCTLGRGVFIGAGSYLANTSLKENTEIPPHTCQL